MDQIHPRVVDQAPQSSGVTLCGGGRHHDRTAGMQSAKRLEHRFVEPERRTAKTRLRGDRPIWGARCCQQGARLAAADTNPRSVSIDGLLGAIVGEISAGVRGGLGRLILDFASRYTTGPERLYAAVVGAAVLGLLVVGLIAAAERAVLAARGQEAG
jgi:hypothetical protein